MRYKLILMFGLVAVVFASVVETSIQAQGIGDRNRPGGRGTYRVTGKVYDSSGKAMRDVTVTASGGETSGASTRTDQEGSFSISGLSSGNYTISAREKGYRTETELVTIPEGAIGGQSYNVAFYLRGVGEAKQAPPRTANSLTEGVPDKAVAKYEKALEKVKKEDLKAALALLDEAIGDHPTFAGAYYEKGAIYLKQEENAKAVEAFLKALSIKPDFIEAKYGYGMARFQNKEYELSEAVFRDVLKEKSEMAEAGQNLGISLFYLNSLDAAEKELRAAASMKGGDKLALIHLYLGQIYIQKQKNTEAVAELEKYLGLAPKAPNADKIRKKVADLKKKS